MKHKFKEVYRNMEMRELVERSQQGDHIALEELVRRNEKIIYNTFYHLDPNRTDIPDLVQEVLFRMTKSVKNLRNPATFKFWLNQIITNLFYDELRRKTKRLTTISLDTPVFESEEEQNSYTRDITDETKIPEERSLGSELDKTIKEAIDSLPEQFRVAIVLRELQGLSYEEIAELTNSSIGTVKSRLARARAKLQDQIKTYLE